MGMFLTAVGGGWGWFAELGSADRLHSFDNHHRLLLPSDIKMEHTHACALSYTTRVACSGGWVGLYFHVVIIVGRNNNCGFNNSDSRVK